MQDLLRSLSPDRNSIEEAMGFVLDHADCACDIVDMIHESLTVVSTTARSKLSRLYLVSDVLYNSVPCVYNSSIFRLRLQQRLPDMFASLHDTYVSISGRMAQETFKDRVLRLLAAWASWNVFSEKYISDLRDTFIGTTANIPLKQLQEQEQDIDGVPIIDDEDIDGVPLY